MTLESGDIIFADLEAKYEDIIQEKDENNFYLKVADYGKYLKENEVNIPAISDLYKQSRIDVADYKNASDDFMAKWKILAQDLVELAEKNGITDPPTNPFINHINEIKGKLNEPPSYDDDYLSYYFRPYRELAQRFRKEGKFDLISQKHFFTAKDVEYLLLQSDYDKAQVAWEKFKLVRAIQPWWAHYQVMRLAHGVFSLQDSKEYFHNDNIIDTIYLYEFQQIARGKTDTVVLNRKNFGEWFTRLHRYLLPRLKVHVSDVSFPESHDDKTILQFGGITYDTKKGTLQYENNSLKDVEPENQEVKFLELLLRANGGIVRYAEVARIVRMNSYSPESTDRDMSMGVQAIMKKLKALMITIGMSSERVNHFMVNKKNAGYKLEV